MAIGVAIFIVGILIAVVWLMLEFKKFRHKYFAIFLIVLILFTYLSFTYVIRGKNVDFGTVSGVINAGKLYFSWLGSLFGNLKFITTNAVKMDWSGQNSTGG
jgi:hypothetical protein